MPAATDAPVSTGHRSRSRGVDESDRPVPLVGHAAVALVLVGLSLLSLYLNQAAGLIQLRYGFWPAAAGVVALTAWIGFARRWPSVVGTGTAITYLVAGATAGVELYVSQVVLFLSFYAVGAWETHRRRAFWVRVAIVLTMAVWLIVAVVMQFLRPDALVLPGAVWAFNVIQWGINIAFFGGAWFFGDRAWQSTKDRRALELANQELAAAHAEILAQQTELTEQAVDGERLRIARELHDVVAHHVTAMGIQTGAARRLLDRDLDASREQLLGVEESSREAIAELHQIVHTLRGTSDTEPLPGLAEIEALVQYAADRGREVTLTRIGDLPDLTPAAELTIFRVVQEALTNAGKHAGPGTRVTVRLRALDDAVEAEVSDDGRGHRRETPPPGAGVGLQGMRERVAAVGGTTEIGPKSRGGWLVRARIPVRIAEAA